MLGFLFFHIFKKTIRRLAIIAALQTPPRQECEREAEKDGEREIKNEKERESEGREGGE